MGVALFEKSKQKNRACCQCRKASTMEEKAVKFPCGAEIQGIGFAPGYGFLFYKKATKSEKKKGD